MSNAQVVGLTPLLPWPLSRWPWIAAPVRAERLAIFRIGLAFILLMDVLTTYVPNATLFFGADSLAAPGIFDWCVTPPKHLLPKNWNEVEEDLEHPPKRFYWSLLYKVEDERIISLALAVWVVALVGLVFGFCTRINAVVVWVISTSFANINTYVDNAGDTVRGIMLFLLILAPSGATWSVDAWLRGRKAPVFISPWMLRLLFVQMVCIYWNNGLQKFIGESWQKGDSLYYVLGDVTLARWSYADIPTPPWLTYGVTRLMTWFVLAWESLFALLLLWRPVRNVALVFGALFHIGILFTMELGFFELYMLCFYLPLVPWEKLTDRWVNRRQAASPQLVAVPVK